MKLLLSFLLLLVAIVDSNGQATTTNYPFQKPFYMTNQFHPFMVRKMDSTLVPTSPVDSYPIVWDVTLGGSMRSAMTLLEMTNINADWRKQGMMVYVATTDRYYKLETNLVDWTELNIAGNGGVANPTPSYLPYNNAGSFSDSFLSQTTNGIYFAYGGTNQLIIRTNSGWTGTGTNYLADDGTYKPSAAGAGITQLTGAVTAGPGFGSVAASLGSFASTNLSGALTDETGTGLAVFSVNASTTNGLMNGIVTNSGVFRLQDGSLSNPSIGNVTSTNSGFYFFTGGYPSLVRNGVGIALAFTDRLQVAGLSFPVTTADVHLSRDAAATLQMGVDAATTVTQTLKAHDGSGTDKDGAVFNIRSGQGTGTGAGGTLSFGTAPAGSSTGSSLNTYTNRYSISQLGNHYFHPPGNNLTNLLTLDGGEVTNSLPVLDIKQTWNNTNVTFTGANISITNSGSASASKLLNVSLNGNQVFGIITNGIVLNSGSYITAGPGQTSSGILFNTGAPRFLVTAADLVMSGNVSIGWNPAASLSYTFTPEALFRYDGAASIQMGVDAASVVTPQTFKAADGSGTDKDGAKFQLRGGQSTGTGRGGDIALATSLSGATGSAVNSYSTRFYLGAKPVALTDTGTNTLFTILCATNTCLGVEMFVSVCVGDANDKQMMSRKYTLDAINDAGTIVMALNGIGTQAVAASAGTLTFDVLAEASNNTNILVRVSADTSLTPTSFTAKWTLNSIHSDGAATVTPE